MLLRSLRRLAAGVIVCLALVLPADPEGVAIDDVGAADNQLVGRQLGPFLGPGRQKIRVWGIDAPDDDRKPYGTKALRQVLGDQTLTCRPVGMSYDRVVARCTDPGGHDIAQAMVETGWALDWPKFSHGLYGPGEARARARHVGVFGTDGPLWR
jgi:endonuclease YncB( thermonuclease family)